MFQASEFGVEDKGTHLLQDVQLSWPCESSDAAFPGLTSLSQGRVMGELRIFILMKGQMDKKCSRAESGEGWRSSTEELRKIDNLKQLPLPHR